MQGVVINKIQRFSDKRGWLCECFRTDQIEESVYPAMSYISMTLPGIARGPHEHIHQTDYFCFLGNSAFKLYLWDNRKDSPTYGQSEVLFMEENVPVMAIIPPGIVHAYKNVGEKEGLVMNYPNKLYAGWGRKEAVDEVRHENLGDSPFRIED